MTSRRLNCRKTLKRELDEAYALRRASEIIDVIHSAYATTEKINFTKSSDQLLMRQVHHTGFVLATFINCSCRGDGVPASVIEALDSWKQLEVRLRKILINLE